MEAGKRGSRLTRQPTGFRDGSREARLLPPTALRLRGFRRILSRTEERTMRSAAALALAISVASLAFTSAAYAQAGQLDTSFGGDGKVTTDVTARGDFGATVAVQADGKIVVAGGASWERNPRFVLLRYNADGTLDSTFGGDGRVTTDFTAAEDAAWGVAIQADGK